MSKTFSNIYNENKPATVDFKKRVNLKDLVNEDSLTVTEISYMKTQFGVKALAILEDKRWFYIPESADKMKDWSVPANFHVVSKTTKLGRNYLTVKNDSYMSTFKNVSIKDLVKYKEEQNFIAYENAESENNIFGQNIEKSSICY